MENETKSIYENNAMIAAGSAIITGFIGWIGSLIRSTLKKIDDSQSTKAELQAFKNEVNLELKHLRELMDHDQPRRK